MRFSKIHGYFVLVKQWRKERCIMEQNIQLFIGFIKACNLGERINGQHTDSVAILPRWTDENHTTLKTAGLQVQNSTWEPLNTKEK